MKDWSDLEEKYQDMRGKDPSAAENFKKQMTERFQKTVQALEEESQAEKRQLQVKTITKPFVFSSTIQFAIICAVKCMAFLKRANDM